MSFNIISLLDTFARNKNNNDNNNNNNNNNEGDAVVAAHAIEQDCYSDHDDDDDDDSYTESNLSTDDVEEADEATLPDNLEEAPGTEDYEDFKATILANAVAEYDSQLLEVENNFINRINMNINQNLSDAFEENEPDALACAHMVVFEDNDDFVVVDEINDDNNIWFPLWIYICSIVDYAIIWLYSLGLDELVLEPCTARWLWNIFEVSLLIYGISSLWNQTIY